MKDSWTAWQLDETVSVFGEWLEVELKQGRSLNEILGIELTAAEKREMNRRANAAVDQLASDGRSGIVAN